jgi:hypothetical protein
MAIVGREAWVRQQERAQAMHTACTIPSITTSRLLLMTSQMTAILQQLELESSVLIEDDVRMLADLVAFNHSEQEASSSFSNDVTAALAVAMLLQAWSVGSLENTSQEDLGMWNTWKPSSLSRSLAAIEKLGWEDWIPLLLPWLPHPQQQSLAAMLLPCTTSPHLSRILISSLAHHAEHALLGPCPEDAIAAMKGLDEYLLHTSSGFSGGDSDSSTNGGTNEAHAALRSLEKVLDTWLGQYVKQLERNSSEEVFQTACQLRTRLALYFSLSFLSSGKERTDGERGDSSSVPIVVENIKMKDMKRVWQRILYLEDDLSTAKQKSKNVDGNKMMPDYSSSIRFSIGLAAHAAVSALFLHPDTLKYSRILSDPDPASPARVTIAAVRMLEQAATIALSTNASAVASNSSVTSSNDVPEMLEILAKNSITFEFYDKSLEILPKLIWTISGLVENLEQKQDLLELFLGNSTPSMFLNARVLLESGSKTRTCTALTSFSQWALKESIALSNLVRTDDVISKIRVLGEEGPGMDAAVHAVFPAALLCPGVLLKVLLDGAAGQREKAMLFAGILEQLPTLRTVTSSHSSTSILLELLKKKLEASSTASLDEDQRGALQHCIITLCSSSTTLSGEEPFLSSAESVTSVPAVSPHEMLQYAVLPALQHAAGTPVESAADLAMLLKSTRLLLQLSTNNTRSVPTSSSTTVSFSTVYTQLSQVIFKFLEFSSRRIDLCPLGLQLPREVIEEAYAVSQLCITYTQTPSTLSLSSFKVARRSQPGSGGGGGERGRRTGAGLIWERSEALCDSLAAHLASHDSSKTSPSSSTLAKALEGIEPSQMKDALVVACAVTLPCCAAEEASILYTWLREAVRYTISLTTGNIVIKSDTEQEEFSKKNYVVDGAVIEVLCRAVHAVAFVPGLIPIAGEEIPITDTPSQIRCRAVARLMQHLSLASQAAVDRAITTPTSLSSPSGFIKGALITRIFKEISRCVASLGRYYNVGTLHVCLMQLIHVLKQEIAKNKLSVTAEMKESIAAAAQLVNDTALLATVAAVLE